MRDFFFLVVGIILIIGSIYIFFTSPAPERYAIQTKPLLGDSTRLRIGEAIIKVEIAETDEKRSKGLSGRESLEKGNGVLFIFDAAGFHGFWMKDMNFPIDIVWISDGWQVVGIERGVGPDTFPKVFYPPSEVMYVLEIPAGSASTLGIDTGLKVYQE